jgi:hypothetical protein
MTANIFFFEERISGIQLPRIAMQRIWTHWTAAGQDNIASGPKFRRPFVNQKTFKKSQNFTKMAFFFINIIIF